MKPDVIIRKAAPGDLPCMLEIENACFGGEAFSRRQLRYLISRAKGIFYAAEFGGKTAGYVSMLKSRRHHNARVYSIAVAPQFWGSGIAGALMDEALYYARRSRAKAVFLEVAAGNAAAIYLYRKKGFSKHSVKKNYYKDGSDAYSMRLDLSKKEDFTRVSRFDL